MDSFELNKVAGAVLGTLLFAFGSGFVAELIYHPKPAGNAGYALPEPGKEAGGGESGAKAEAPKADSIATLLASADAAKGKAGTKPCQACHSFEKGGPNKIGPDLWEVVGRKKGSHEGFDYSAGMKEKGGEWTYEDLDQFIENPKGYVKGTKMAFQGIGEPKARADVILYLHSLAESPKPLPAAETKDEKAAEGGKKPEGDKKAEGGAAADPVVAKVASADPAKGKDGTKPCQACHSFEKGGPNKIGPDLYDVVGRKKGSHEGFDYSAAMKEKGGEWTIADLNHFLTKPSDYVKGTKMAFQGIAADDKRAEVIAYLRTLSENPKPLPGADKKDEGKKADGAAKPEEKAAEKPAEAKPEQSKPAGAEAKPAEAKPAEAKPAEAKPAEAKPAEAKPAEAKPAEAKPAESEKKAEAPKPAEDSKPPEAKAADGEKKAEEPKPAEAEPAETKPAEEPKPAETAPAEGEKKADDAKPADPAAEKPAEAKSAEDEKKPDEPKP